MKTRIPTLIGILLTLLALWLLISQSQFSQQLLERLDNLAYDLQLRTHILTHTQRLDTPIAIIDIDDKSLKNEGRWPWSRTKMAELVDQLNKQGASVIAFDMFFPEATTNIALLVKNELSKNNMMVPSLEKTLQKSIPLFDQDAVFAKSIANAHVVTALSFLSQNLQQNILPKPLLKLTPLQIKNLDIYLAHGFIGNLPLIQQASIGSGFLNIFSDNDGIFRRAPLLIEYQGGVYASLALQAIITFLNTPIKLITPVYNDEIKLEGIQLGSIAIPTDAKGQVFIPFVGHSYTFPYFSATDVLHDNVPKDALSGKILFVGSSATGSGDLKPTAIENPFPGVEIQATLAHALLLNHFPYKPAWTFGAQVLITFLLGMICALIFPYCGPRILGAVIVFLPPGFFVLNNWIWQTSGLILSVIVPLMLILFIALFNIIFGYVFEARRREHLKNMFGQYVPEKHIDAMLKKSSNYALSGEDRQMSVLFADIRNFTSISENLPASSLVAMLNTYFTPMTEIIFKHQGTIDKYVGDTIMAFWGAPLRDKHHARHAIQSALDMQAKLHAMRKEIQKTDWPKIQMGIGINTGMMAVGDMGSYFRRNYTVLGDAVNLASRVEGLTKYYGVNIIVTQETAKNQTDFVFRKLDLVRVKGKKHGLSIFEVICERAQLSAAISRELSLYDKALAHYFDKNWDEAEDIFQRLQNEYPDTKIYRLYLERIKEFKTNPVPENWDGIYLHTSK